MREDRDNGMASIQLSLKHGFCAFLKTFVKRVSCHLRVNVSLSDSMPDLTPCERASGRVLKLCRRPVSLKEDNRSHCDLSGATV